MGIIVKQPKSSSLLPYMLFVLEGFRGVASQNPTTKTTSKRHKKYTIFNHKQLLEYQIMLFKHDNHVILRGCVSAIFSKIDHAAIVSSFSYFFSSERTFFPPKIDALISCIVNRVSAMPRHEQVVFWIRLIHFAVANEIIVLYRILCFHCFLDQLLCRFPRRLSSLGNRNRPARPYSIVSEGSKMGFMTGCGCVAVVSVYRQFDRLFTIFPSSYGGKKSWCVSESS